MADPAPEASRVLAGWKQIGPADRQAILDALPSERRQQLEGLLADEQADVAADRKYMIYSGWLRPFIEAAHSPSPETAQKPAVLDALRRAHERIVPEAAADHAASMLGRVRRTFADWADRL